MAIAKFYCDVLQDGQIVEKNHLFDELIHKNRAELTEYIARKGYQDGHAVAFWDMDADETAIYKNCLIV